MEDVVLVEVLERLAGLDEVLAGLFFLEALPLLDVVVEVAVLDVLEDHVDGAGLLEAVVERDDVGVVAAEMHFDFAFDALLLVGGLDVAGLDGLDGVELLRLGVGG